LASQRGDDIVPVDFEEDKDFLYPVRIDIRAIDRYHLLVDLIDCITNRLQLSLTHIVTKEKDEIVDCSMEFQVHSSAEMQEAIAGISQINGVDEVKQRIEY
jgi:GTP pyrophosphokinase